MSWIVLFLLSLVAETLSMITIDNVCTFRTGGNLFSLTFLQADIPYKIVDGATTVYFNFCKAFIP